MLGVAREKPTLWFHFELQLTRASRLLQSSARSSMSHNVFIQQEGAARGHKECQPRFSEPLQLGQLNNCSE